MSDSQLGEEELKNTLELPAVVGSDIVNLWSGGSEWSNDDRPQNCREVAATSHERDNIVKREVLYTQHREPSPCRTLLESSGQIDQYSSSTPVRLSL